VKDTSRVPSGLTPLAAHLRKWGLVAHRVVAMKPTRATMERVRILNFFIGNF
jgi:hypothetical protein